MKLFRSGICFLCLLAAVNVAKAEDAVFLDEDNGAVRINGKACEKFTPNEAKSTVRVRVTDKASFLAVSLMEDVSSLRDEFNDHDYNVLVYNLVDNAIEDLTVRTTKQDTEELCVEVNGYIRPDSVIQAVTELEIAETNNGTDKETMTDIVKDVNTSYSEIKSGKAEIIPPTEETELVKYKAQGQAV